MMATCLDKKLQTARRRNVVDKDNDDDARLLHIVQQGLIFDNSAQSDHRH